MGGSFRPTRDICGVQPVFGEATAFRELGRAFGVAIEKAQRGWHTTGMSS